MMSPHVGCTNNNVAVAVLQSLVAVRLVLCVDRFKALILSFIHFSSLLPAVGGLGYVWMYIYANVGGELWCRCAFKPATVDYLDAMLTLFQVVTGSNWHELMLEQLRKFNAGESPTDRFMFWTSMLFYVSFFFVAVVVVLNLMISVIIDAHLVESELQSEEQHILLSAAEEAENDLDKSNRNSVRSHDSAQSNRISVQMVRRYSRELARGAMSDNRHEVSELQELTNFAPIDLVQAAQKKKEETQSSGRRRSSINKFRSAVQGVVFTQRTRHMSHATEGLIERNAESDKGRTGLLAPSASGSIQEEDESRDLEPAPLKTTPSLTPTISAAPTRRISGQSRRTSTIEAIPEETGGGEHDGEESENSGHESAGHESENSGTESEDLPAPPPPRRPVTEEIIGYSVP
eukprot:CAMPEP_0175937218 /NCGR_PEP_ID=MMETSP0108-20121206/22022_1 /TAXON_ID=195067 ORGANISM="Goniomonas pacifica, Strain CCMP1869" /NCGR_SAMPLE_ID=MMETSP0108 /ASSEMBLY_ACC=CAM_ASM_000204 /LENGTH=403 /DNA_ID=CAMNT_0017261341 /DNA_START=1 /DNA_END=1215 /DNA_ORIENTATION=-